MPATSDRSVPAPRASSLEALWLRQPSFVRFLCLWLVCAVALLFSLRPILHDAHYWDAGGCYVMEARLHFLYGADLQAIRAHLDQYLLRPVFYTGLLSVVMRTLGDSSFILHVFHVVFCSMMPAALAEIAVALGGRPWQGWLAAFLCATTPIFIGQIGLVQTDLPLATLLALAWLSLLKERRGLFCLFSSLAVWTKESGYFVAVPAAILLWWQAGAATILAQLRPGRTTWRDLWRLLWAAWPSLAPPLALIAWLAVRRAIKGNWMESDHAQALSPIAPAAHYHNWLDAGRFAASFLLLIAVYHAWRNSNSHHRRTILCTALAFLLLPFLFPAFLPRYMLPSLVFSVPLAALGLGYISNYWRMRMVILVSAIQLMAQTGRLTIKDIAHLENSLTYRRLLHSQQQAAVLLAAQQPQQVLAGFPGAFVLSADPMMGYLPRPLRSLVPMPGDTLDKWCQADWLLEAQDDTVQPAIRALRARGSLRLFAELGPPPRESGAVVLDKERDETIRIYRIDCRTAASTPPPRKAKAAAP